MLPISRRYNHFVFAVLQSGLTTLIATAIAIFSQPATDNAVRHWLLAWGASWLAMLPVVILAAPAIRALAIALTRETDENSPISG